MKAKHILSMMLAILMVSSIFIPVVDADTSAGIGLDATIKEPKPDIAITVDVDSIGFGELLPGETSASSPVVVTNVGLKEIDVTATVSDNEDQEAVFFPGLLIDGAAWGEYSTQLVSDDSDSFDVALQVPDTVTIRGAIGGSLIVYAEEHAAGTTVLYDDTVELTAGDTFGFTSVDGTVYTGLNALTDLGALYATGLDLEVSDEWYALYGTFFLESVEGIANAPDWSYSWALYINDEYAQIGLYGNAVADGDNVKLYYLPYDADFNPLINHALYLVDIDVAVSYVSPVAGFSASPLSGEAPLTVQFTDGSVGAVSWSWDFGDETTSEEQSPQHTYASEGVYTVTLTVTNSAGEDTATETVTVTEAVVAPVAAFTSSWVIGVPLAVEFIDTSSNVPTSWSWTFGDGATSTDRNPTHTYASGGTKTVTLIASNAGGISTVTKTVTFPAAPVADFSASATSVTAPWGEVSFNDKSTGSPTSWLWNFGDGSTSTARSPTHVYTAPGVYTVSLTATNAGGSNTKTVADRITVWAPAPVAFFEPLSTGLHAEFLDLTSDMEPHLSPLQWHWDFGDGATLDYTEYRETAEHVYAAPGTYHVTLTATNYYGNSTYGLEVTVA